MQLAKECGNYVSRLLLARSGLFGTVPRTSALPLKADIKNWMAAVALIASALPLEPDM
jgi:hypothetical protein